MKPVAETIAAVEPPGILRAFSNPRSVPVILLIALLISLPSLWIGLFSDDYFHRAILTEKTVVPVAEDWSLFGLFSFEFGSAAHIYQSINIGALPWWSDVNVKMQFFRPISELSHWIDYQLFPDSPGLMHAHNILWYLTLLGAAWLVLRRLFPARWMAVLALAMLALDGSNGGAMGWIADRNALITTALGLLTLHLHLQGRWDRNQWLVTPALLCFSVTLLAGENGFSTTAYLFAFALWLDPQKTFFKRLLTLVPYTIVSVIWLGFYKWASFGAHGSGMYIDPITAPLQYLNALQERMPLLLEAHLSGLPISLEETRMPGPLRAIFLAIAAALIWPALKQSASARFFLTGLLVSLLPVCAAKPEDRLLVFSSFAAMGLVASAMIYWFGRVEQTLVTRVARAITVLMLFIHLVCSPVAFIANYQLPAMALHRITTQPALSMPVTADDAERDVVLLNPPVVAAAFFHAWVRMGNDLPVARNSWILASGMHPLKVTRTDDKTLLLEPQAGFLDTANDWYIRSPEKQFVVGETIDQGRMQATIVQLTSDGRPSQVEFRFADSLDSDRLRVMRWQDTSKGIFAEGHWVDWTPPALGVTETLQLNMAGKLMSASTKSLKQESLKRASLE